jgi:prepilin-type processing-associated H-X9-DG protein
MRSFRWTHFMALIAGAGTLLGVYLYLTRPIRPVVAIPDTCLSHVKQLGLAMAMYYSDYEVLPSAKWSGALRPYVKTDLLFKCTQVEKGSGYAMNAYLVDRPLPEEQKDLPLLFETNDLRPDRTETKIAPIDPARHRDNNVIAFADGHAKHVPQGEAAAYDLRPKPARSPRPTPSR